ncbi:MAG: ABC transporter permease subunit [Actinobacteria bacterium]|nr:ABC transporter permease subunit [Actinomycetota bacterium]
MNRRAVLAIAGRDLRIVRRSRAVITPIVLVPLILLLVPPVALLGAAGSPEALANELQPLLARLSPELPGLPSAPEQQAILLILVYVFAPLFLLVPIMVASVTAADSIVGERERQTLEGLLHSPTTDRELFIGKLLAPWALAVLVAFGSAACYGLVANVVLGRYGLPPSFPNQVWAVLVLWVAPAAAGVGLGLIVLVSGRVKTFQEASQISGVVVVPVVGMVIAQVAGVFLFDVALLVGLGCVLWLLTLLTMRIAGRRFQRDRLLSGN